ncbi:MAG: GIY-YIG nuclease family protein [Bacteroidota bacterium]
MSHFVYVIRSLKDGRYYIGESTNVTIRLREHNEGFVKSTKNRTPFILVYTEIHDSRISALRREKQIKSYKGGNAFRKLLNLADK